MYPRRICVSLLLTASILFADGFHLPTFEAELLAPAVGGSDFLWIGFKTSDEQAFELETGFHSVFVEETVAAQGTPRLRFSDCSSVRELTPAAWPGLVACDGGLFQLAGLLRPNTWYEIVVEVEVLHADDAADVAKKRCSKNTPAPARQRTQDAKNKAGRVQKRVSDRQRGDESVEPTGGEESEESVRHVRRKERRNGTGVGVRKKGQRERSKGTLPARGCDVEQGKNSYFENAYRKRRAEQERAQQESGTVQWSTSKREMEKWSLRHVAATYAWKACYE